MPGGADFDGDRLADPLLYNLLSGSWFLRLSGRGYAGTLALDLLGGPDFLSAPADFDGDGLADPAVYQEATGTWLVMMSADGYAAAMNPYAPRAAQEAGALSSAFGGPGWVAACADYDGDRRADYGVYQPGEARWRIKLSGSTYATLDLPGLLGGPGTVAIPADYDGDQFADPAAYRWADRTWFGRLSTAHYALVHSAYHGALGWMPVPADYDGDGKADLALMDPATGCWSVWLSGAHYARLDPPGFLTWP